MKKSILKIIAYSVFSVISFILFILSFNIAFTSSDFNKMALFGFLSILWAYVFIFNIIMAINVSFKEK